MMSPPAGLIDDEDKNNPNAVLETAARELAEETGYKMGPADSLKVVNPLVYSTPGFTDESNALVCAVLNVPSLDVFNNNGAVGAECFDGFVFLTRDEALKVIKNGRDPRGNRYPLYAWAALAYFVLGEYDNE